jgi:integrase
VTPQKGKSAQDHDRRILPLLMKAFGAHRRPDTLNVRDWNSFIRRRQSGALALAGREGQPVRNRVIEQNLKLLLAVLNWAERARDDGGYLLDRNPLRGLKVPKEENPRRPMLTVEQFKALRSVAAQRSLVAERFVMLAWYAGHRGHSIRHLRWSDVDLEGGTIRWRAGNDKIKYEHRNPMHPDLIAFLKADRARTKAIGDAWLFPGNKRGAPLTRNQSVNLFRKLAVKAGLPKGEGYGWHACRRAFANHLRDVPLRDLKDLGGWKTERTVVAVYLQPNEDAQRSALAKLKGA